MTGAPWAKAAIARAMYGPTPGSSSSSAGSSGRVPPWSATTARAAACRCRARAVPRTLPAFQHVGERGGRERLDGRERAEEPLVVRDRLLDPGLLEEHFGDPHVVGVAVPTPREGPSMRAKPSKERSGERGREVPPTSRAATRRRPHAAAKMEPHV